MRRALLLLRRRRGRGDRTTLATLAGHDGAEGIGAHADGRGRGLWRTLVGRRADHGALGSATSGLFELSAEMGDLFFKPAGHDGQRTLRGRNGELEGGTYFCLSAMWVCSIA